jgi:ABC-type amino acid transport substrate-binding protein
LLESADAALDKMQKSGEANAIIKRWIPHFK